MKFWQSYLFLLILMFAECKQALSCVSTATTSCCSETKKLVDGADLSCFDLEHDEDKSTENISDESDNSCDDSCLCSYPTPIFCVYNLDDLKPTNIEVFTPAYSDNTRIFDPIFDLLRPPNV